MPTNKPGYVYILTNPSFREDWVKIAKSSPFEIFATIICTTQKQTLYLQSTAEKCELFTLFCT